MVNRHGSESADAPEAEMIGGSENYGELLKTVGFLTRAVQIRIFREFFAEFSEGDVTPATHATLHLIWKNPGIRQGRIADMLDILDPNMTPLIRRLEAAGIVRRESHPDDKRSLSLFLTEAGEKWAMAIDDRTNKLEQVYAATLSPLEREFLVSLLERVHAHLAARQASAPPEISSPKRGKTRRRAGSRARI